MPTPSKVFVGKAGTVVADDQIDRVALLPGRHRDRGAGSGVAQSVVEGDVEKLFQIVAGELHRDAGLT